MAATTATEAILIDKFRIELKGILDEERLANDIFLLRWIRARNHDLEKAKDMMLSHLKWYTEKNIASLQTAVRPAFFDKFFKHYYDEHAVDKFGRPVFITPVGQWNIKEMLRLCSPEQIVLEFARVLELMKGRVEAAQAHAAGLGHGNMVQMVAVGDFHGLENHNHNQLLN